MNATLRHLTRTGYAAPCGLRALQHDHNASTRARLYRSARRTAIMPAAANGAIVPPSVRTLAPPSVRGQGGRPGPKMPLVQHARLADTEVLKLKTPHSGFHLDSDREFMEGWYWRVSTVHPGQCLLRPVAWPVVNRRMACPPELNGSY